MNVTREMLQAATQKAIEAGLLPRHSAPDELAVNQDLLCLVLQAALNAIPGEASRPLRIRLAIETPKPVSKWFAGPESLEAVPYRNLAK